MTDNGNTPLDLEQLLKEYETGVAAPGSATAWLKARSAIEGQLADLTSGQFKRLEKADRTLAAKAEEVVGSLGDEIKAERGAFPTGHWWWNLEYVSAAVPAIAPKPPTRTERIVNNVLNVVLLLALVGAGFLFLQRSGVITLPTPVPTVRPSSTPLPTMTLNPVAFDFTTAKPFKAEFGIFEIPVPDGWNNDSGSSLERFQFSYGDAQAPRGGLVVFFEETSALYNRLSLTGSVDTATAALQQFKDAGLTPQGVIAGEITQAKIGTYDAASLAYAQPMGQGSPDVQETEIRLALVPGTNKGLLVAAFGESTIWKDLKGITDQMIAGIVLRPDAFPTTTPTSTLHPLLITATAVQTQIIGLTPTATHTPTGTATPSGTPEATPATTTAATTEATSTATTTAPTTAPTTDPTSAATSAATAEVTPEATPEATAAATTAP